MRRSVTWKLLEEQDPLGNRENMNTLGVISLNKTIFNMGDVGYMSSSNNNNTEDASAVTENIISKITSEQPSMITVIVSFSAVAVGFTVMVVFIMKLMSHIGKQRFNLVPYARCDETQRPSYANHSTISMNSECPDDKSHAMELLPIDRRPSNAAEEHVDDNAGSDDDDADSPDEDILKTCHHGGRECSNLMETCIHFTDVSGSISNIHEAEEDMRRQSMKIDCNNQIRRMSKQSSKRRRKSSTATMLVAAAIARSESFHKSDTLLEVKDSDGDLV